MELYPSIDLQNGQCVRLVQGDFGTVHTVAPDAVAVAASYRDAGAKVIHVVDLDGAKDGVRKNAALVGAIVRAAQPALVELGGGLRDMDSLAEVDSLGVWRFVIGSAALSNPGFVKEALALYGERIAVGIDARDGKVRSHGWTDDSGRDELAFAREAVSWGVKTIIYTDIAVDGLLGGPSLKRLAALRKALPWVFLVASGGVSSLEDVRALRRMGAGAAIAGKALYTGDLPLEAALFEARGGLPMDVLAELYHTVVSRRENPVENSYTNYLFAQGTDKICKKIGEECAETIIAAKNNDPAGLTGEVADVLYHLLVLLAERGVPWDDVRDELERRGKKIGNKKELHHVDRNT